MTNSGVPDTIVDFWLGHEIGDMARAYKSVQFEELKRMYLEREPLISIAPKVDVEKIEAGLETKWKIQNENVHSLVDSVAIENRQLRIEIAELRKDFQDLAEVVRHREMLEAEKESGEAFKQEQKDRTEIMKKLKKQK